MPNAFDDLVPPPTVLPKNGPPNAFDDLLPPKEGAVEDVLKSIPAGLARGTAFATGIGGDLQNLAKSGSDWAYNHLPAAPTWLKKGLDYLENDPETQRLGKMYGGRSDVLGGDTPLPTSQDVQSGIESVTGPLHQPSTTAGKIANTAAEFVPGALAGPGGIARRVIQYGVVPGAASEIAGQYAEGKKIPGTNIDAEVPARIATAMIAPGAARGTITPFTANPERVAQNEYLRQRGIFGTAGEQSGNPGLKYAESLLRDVPFASENAAQIGTGNFATYTDLLLQQAGMRGRAQPDVLGRGLEAIQNRYNYLRNTYDMGLAGPPGGTSSAWGDIVNHVTNYENRTNPYYRSPVPAQIRDSISDWMSSQGGRLSGTQYQQMRSALRSDARAAMDSNNVNDHYLGTTLHNIADSLDDAMENSIRMVNPDDANGFRETNRLYRNFHTLLDATRGTDLQEGLIFPYQMKNAIIKNEGLDRYSMGRGDFTMLTRAANDILGNKLPNSGTAQREVIIKMLGDLLSVGGAGAGGIFGMAHGGGMAGAEGGILGGVMGHPIAGTINLAAFPAASRFLYSPMVQGTGRGGLFNRGWFTNQAIPQLPPDQLDQARQLMRIRAVLGATQPKALPPPQPGQAQGQ